MRSFTELAQKNNVSITPVGGGRGGMGGGALQPGARGANSNNLIRQIQEKFPQEYAEVQKLRQSDPTAYREKMRELQSKLNTEN